MAFIAKAWRTKFWQLLFCGLILLSAVDSSRHPIADNDDQPTANLKLGRFVESIAKTLDDGIPSSQPTSQPTSQPSSQSTSNPTADPTSQPTSAPSRQPTSVPTCMPTSLPTLQPTSAPTLMPTKFSSAEPTAQPTSQPSSMPSSVPSGAPSVQPTSAPSTYPSTAPTAQPNAPPTSEPSVRPSSSPSSMPTSMPSPQGIMGDQWWYLVTARCDLGATSYHSDAGTDILDAVVYAFSFVLTELLDEAERENVEVTAVTIADSSSAHVQEHTMATHWANHVTNPIEATSAMLRSYGSHQTAPQSEHRAYMIEAWCPDHPTAIKVYQAMGHISFEPAEILEPIHEKGFYDVVNVTVSALTLSTTTELPPSLSGDDLSPVRITWIIVGTLVVFSVGLFLLSRMRYLKYLCCTKTCLEDVARSWYTALADGCMLCLRSVGLVSSDLRLYYGSGFDLTTQEEEADFYGENRGNLPSDGLDIHYGDNRTQRKQYLEDDEDRRPAAQRRTIAGRLRGLIGLGGSSNSSGAGDSSTMGARGRPAPPPSPPIPGSLEMRRWSDNDVLRPITTARYSDRPVVTLRDPAMSDLSSGSVSRLVHSSLPRPPRPSSASTPNRYAAVGGTTAYNPLSDGIDDIGDFNGPSQHAHAADLVEEPLESYESYVV